MENVRIGAMFNLCKKYYDLYNLFADDSDLAKRYRTKAVAINEAIDAVDLSEEFREWCRKHKSDDYE